MTIGPGGYGRYNDDPSEIGCPRAKSYMSPCVARDGHLACADDGVCVGCGQHPVMLLEELRRLISADSHPPTTAERAADQLTVLVREVTQ